MFFSLFFRILFIHIYHVSHRRRRHRNCRSFSILLRFCNVLYICTFFSAFFFTFLRLSLALRFYFGCNTLMRKAFSVSTYLHTYNISKSNSNRSETNRKWKWKKKNWSSDGKDCCCDGNTMKKMAFTKRGRYVMEISQCLCIVRSILSISFCDCFAVFSTFFFSFSFALVFMFAIMLKNEQYEMLHTRNKTSSLA